MKTIISTTWALVVAPVLGAADPVVIKDFSIVEHYGVHHPEQVIDFDLPKRMTPGSVHMIGPDGQPVVSQILEGGTKIAVLAQLGPNETKTWKLVSGPGPKTLTPLVSVTEGTLGRLPVWTITNKLTGVKVPQRVPTALVTSEAYRPFWFKLAARDYNLLFAPAPIQDIRWQDGKWAASTATPASFKPVMEFRNVSRFDKFEAKVIERGPLRATVEMAYFLQGTDITLDGKTKLQKAGPVSYKCRVIITANRPSIMVDEESTGNGIWHLDLHQQLKPNMIRFRGHSSSQVKFGQNEDGTLYRSSNEEDSCDGFVPFKIDRFRNISYQTMDDAFGTISPWNPWSYNGGWYWQMYDKDGTETSNMIGLFAARCGSALGACNNGPGFWYSPAPPSVNPKAKPIPPLSGIASVNSRGAVDARYFPKSRVIWGIFVGKKGNLKPAREVQAINEEMNLQGGFSLNKFHRYHVDFPDPKGGYGSLFMAREAVEDVKKRVREDRSGPHGKGYYGYLYQAEPYGRDLFDLWAETGREKFDKAVRKSIDSGRELAKTLVKGDGIFDAHWAYWHGGQRMQIQLLFLDQYLADSRCTEEQRRLLKATAVLFGSVLWDNDFVPLDNHEGFNMGTANMPVQMAMARQMYSQFLATHPLFVERARDVAAKGRSMSDWIFDENGIPAQCPHYTGSTFWPTLNLQNMVKQTSGIDPFQDNRRIARFGEFYLNLLTPPDPRLARFGDKGLRVPVAMGDNGLDANLIYGLLGTALQNSEQSLSGRLMGAWQQSGRPHNGFYGSSSVMIDDRLPSHDPKLGDYVGKNYFTVLRQGWGTPHESAIWFINGDRYADHRHYDHGSIVIHALGKPLVEHWLAMYQPHTGGSFTQNNCTIDLGLPHSWYADGVDSRETTTPWTKSESLNETSQTDTGMSRARFTATLMTGSGSSQKKRQFQWTRSVAVLRAKPEQPIYVIRDDFDNPDVFKLLTFQFQARGEVDSSLGKITIDESRSCPRAEKPKKPDEMPFVGSVRKLSLGANKFSFRGTFGVNADVYVLGEGIEATLGNWGIGIQSGSAPDDQRRQRMHTLRLRTNATTFTIIAPWTKAPTEITMARDGEDYILTTSEHQYRVTANKVEVKAK